MAHVYMFTYTIYMYNTATDFIVELQQSMTKRLKQNEIHVFNAYINNIYAPKLHVIIARNLYL